MKDLICVLFLLVIIAFIFPHQYPFQHKVPNGADAVAGIGAMHQVNEWERDGKEDFSRLAAIICLAMVCIFSYLLWVYRKNTDKKLVLAFVFTLILFTVNIYQWFGGII